jgi:AcrR family transcriptional regulator
MTAKAPSPQEPRRLRTLAAMLEAGAELLAERPIDAIPVNDIVERAGVAKGSFFNHFASKDDFADQIVTRIRSRIEARIEAANRGVSDPCSRLARGLAAYVDFALAQPRDVYILLRAQPQGSEPSHPMNAGLRADLVAGQANGDFTFGDLETALIFVIGAAQIILATLARRAMSRAEATALTAGMLDLVLIALTRDPGRSETAAQAAMALIEA